MTEWAGHAAAWRSRGGIRIASGIARVVLEARRTDGVSYGTGWTHDAYDRTRTLTLPADPPPSGPIETLTFSYGPHLLLTDLTSSLGGPALLSGASYNALGLPTGWTVGGVATASLGYWGIDAAGSPYGALRSHRLAAGGNPALMDRVLSYDPAGNVSRLIDNTTGETLDYGSDFLDRLTGVSAALTESYQCDPIGNLTTKAGVSQHYPGAGEAGPRHAPVWVGSPADALAYDPNGNLVSRGATGFQYDPRNRLAKVSVGGQTVARYTHDGDGGRTKRLDQNGTVHYVRRHYERNVGNGGALPDVVTKYYEAQLGTRRVLVAFRAGRQPPLRRHRSTRITVGARPSDRALAPDTTQREPFGPTPGIIIVMQPGGGSENGGPYVTLAVLCERVLDERDGALSLIRLVDRVTRSGPATELKMAPFPLDLRWCWASAPAPRAAAHNRHASRDSLGPGAARVPSACPLGGPRAWTHADRPSWIPRRSRGGLLLQGIPGRPLPDPGAPPCRLPTWRVRTNQPARQASRDDGAALCDNPALCLTLAH